MDAKEKGFHEWSYDRIRPNGPLPSSWQSFSAGWEAALEYVRQRQKRLEETKAGMDKDLQKLKDIIRKKVKEIK